MIVDMRQNHFSEAYCKTLQKAIAEKNAGKIYTKGKSMAPLISADNYVSIISARSPLKNGRCYLFMYNGDAYIHRLIRSNSHEAIFAGDTTYCCERVTKNQIICEAHVAENKVCRSLIVCINMLFSFAGHKSAFFQKLRVHILKKITAIMIKENKNEKRI